MRELCSDRDVRIFALAFYGSRSEGQRSVRVTAGGRDYGTYRDTGDLEYCSSDQHNPQYWDYASVYQLRRNIGAVSADRDGDCAGGQQEIE